MNPRPHNKPDDITTNELDFITNFKLNSKFINIRIRYKIQFVIPSLYGSAPVLICILFWNLKNKNDKNTTNI